MAIPEKRHFILQIALKCADLGNPCRPWNLSKQWSEQICNEFYRQGDYERQLNIPITPICDRQRTGIARIQTGITKPIKMLESENKIFNFRVFQEYRQPFV